MGTRIGVKASSGTGREGGGGEGGGHKEAEEPGTGGREVEGGEEGARMGGEGEGEREGGLSSLLTVPTVPQRQKCLVPWTPALSTASLSTRTMTREVSGSPGGYPEAFPVTARNSDRIGRKPRPIAAKMRLAMPSRATSPNLVKVMTNRARCPVVDSERTLARGTMKGFPSISRERLGARRRRSRARMASGVSRKWRGRIAPGAIGSEGKEAP
jgi:hypothetical protein